MRHVPGANWEVASSKLFTLFALRITGDFTLMREHYRQYLGEARQRGDHYVESTMRRLCVPMWLAADDPGEAARELSRATWVPESSGYHVQHFHELVARGEIALYTGEPADEAAMREGLERLSRSLLLRITMVRLQHEYFLGRHALAGKEALKAVEGHAKILMKLGNPVGQVWARVLRAGVALASSDKSRADAMLVAADKAANDAGMKLTSAVARYRLAELRKDDALLAQCSTEMSALGVRVPSKIAALLLPTR
jgi:hypothetical protein